MSLTKEQNERYETMQAVLQYFYRDNTQSGAHCRYNIKYHLVWIPKYRRKVLIGKIADRLKEILVEIARRYKMQIIAQEIMPDHVHMLVEAPPTLSPSVIVGRFKGISFRNKTTYLERSNFMGCWVLCGNSCRWCNHRNCS